MDSAFPQLVNMVNPSSEPCLLTWPVDTAGLQEHGDDRCATLPFRRSLLPRAPSSQAQTFQKHCIPPRGNRPAA